MDKKQLLAAMKIHNDIEILENEKDPNNLDYFSIFDLFNNAENLIPQYFKSNTAANMVLEFKEKCVREFDTLKIELHQILNQELEKL